MAKFPLMLRSPLALVGSIIASVALAPMSVGADEVPPEDRVLEIVVTIGKRVEKLQNVAGSVAAFNAEKMEMANITDVYETMRLTPNAIVKGASTNEGAEISIRGISEAFSAQSPVARHVNGLFKFDQQSYDGQFYDLERMEIALGPVGTVYGRNATGGAMNLIWKRPEASFEALGDFTAGNYDAYEARGLVNVPFFGEGDERLMGRFVVQASERDGYIDNGLADGADDPGTTESLALRASLRSVFSENGEFTLRGRWYEEDSAPTSAVPIYLDTKAISDLSELGVPAGEFFDPLNGLIGFKNALSDMFGIPADALDDFLTDPDIFGFSPDLLIPVKNVSGRDVNSRVHLLGDTKLEDYSVDGELQWLFADMGFLGDVQMNLLGGFEHIDHDQVSNTDGVEVPIVDNLQAIDIDLTTAELRFSSDNGEKLEWIAGFFVFEREADITSTSYIPFGVIANNEKSKQSGYAPFVNLIWHPSEQFELSGGLRWNVDEYDMTKTDLPSIAGPGGTLQADETYEELTGELIGKYFINDDVMTYLKLSRGYKTGFLEIDANVDAAEPVNQVEPEFVNAIESGLKTSWMNGRMHANLTAFYYEYDDLQVEQFDGLEIQTLNAAEATVWGVEAMLTVTPTPEWLINLSLGHLDATFDEFATLDAFDGVVKDLSGNHLEDAPEWQAALYTTYDFDLGNYGSLTGVLVSSWSDSYYRRPFNVDLIDKVDSFTRTDLRLVWKDINQRWSAELFVENIEDEIVIPAGVVLGSQLQGVVPGFGILAPRVYGFRIGFRTGNS